MHPFKKAFRDKDVILKRFGVDGEWKIFQLFLTQQKSHNKKRRALTEMWRKARGLESSGAVKA